MALQRISVVSVPVGAQDRARRFYADQLGFEVVADAPFGEGMRWVELRPPAGGTSIALVTWFDRMPPGSVQGLVVRTDDVLGDATRRRSRGVRLRQAVEEARGGLSQRSTISTATDGCSSNRGDDGPLAGTG